MSTPSLADEGLLDTADIASMMKLSREYVTDRLTKKPGFPKPHVNYSQKLRRWDKDEVMAFLSTPKPKKRKTTQ